MRQLHGVAVGMGHNEGACVGKGAMSSSCTAAMCRVHGGAGSGQGKLTLVEGLIPAAAVLDESMPDSLPITAPHEQASACGQQPWPPV